MAAVSVVPFVVPALYVLISGRRAVRIAMVSMVLIGVIAWCAATWVNVTIYSTGFDYAHFAPQTYLSLMFGRYAFTPSLFLLSVPVFALSVWRERRITAPGPQHVAVRRFAVKALAVGAIALSIGVLCAQLLYFVPSSTMRSGGAE